MTAIDWSHIQGGGGEGVLRGVLTSLLKDLTRNYYKIRKIVLLILF